MAESIILVTKLFPYENDTGEMYLRSEIYELASSFHKVIILACDACEGNDYVIESLPENVIPVALQKSKFGRSKISYSVGIVKALFAKWDEHFIAEWKSRNNWKEKLFLLYFQAKCDRRLNAIASRKSVFNDLGSGVCVYSYRFFDAAYVAVKIKELFLNTYTVNCISRAHGYDLYEERNGLCYLPMRRYLLEKLNLVLPCSKDGADYLAQKYPMYADKIKCSYLGSQNVICPEYVATDKLELVSCSAILPVKRVHLIAQLVRNLSKQIPVSWTHIGDGPERHKIESEYQDLAESGVMTLVGWKTPDEVKELYQKGTYDLFINLSTSEGLPQAIMEALSYGIPVVATDAGGNRECVLGGQNGYIIPVSYTENDLVEWIVEYHKRKRKIQFRKNARLHWEKYFDAENNIKKFIYLINSM